MARRSRKRGKTRPTAATPRAAAPQPTQPPAPPDRPAPPAAPRQQVPPAHLPQASRSERRNAEVRAALRPLAPGERPGAIVVGSLLAGVVGVGQLIAFLAGLKVHHDRPAAGGIIAFCFVMVVCAVGMWRLWYGAVLGFMALLAIVVTLFALFLIEASNVLGVIVALAVIGGGGYLFYKLVRVLSRIQMPRRPGAD